MGRGIIFLPNNKLYTESIKLLALDRTIYDKTAIAMALIQTITLIAGRVTPRIFKS
jgi:hypothetical protein